MNGEETFRCQSNGAECGPYTRDEIESYLAKGLMNMEDQVYDPAAGSWKSISQFLSGSLEPKPESSSLAAPPMRAGTTPKTITPALRKPIEETIQYGSADEPDKPGWLSRTFSWLLGSTANFVVSLVASLAVCVAINWIYKMIISGKYEAERAIATGNIVGKDEWLAAHNSMIDAHNNFNTAFNAADDMPAMSAAINKLTEKLKAIDTSDCPEKYRAEFVRLIETFERMAETLEQNDNDSFLKHSKKGREIYNHLDDILMATGFYTEKPKRP